MHIFAKINNSLVKLVKIKDTYLWEVIDDYNMLVKSADPIRFFPMSNTILDMSIMENLKTRDLEHYDYDHQHYIFFEEDLEFSTIIRE